MKINKDWKTVFKRYSFITHLLVAISSVGLLGMPPYIDYIPMWAGLSLMATFALMGIVGSFIKQEVSCQDVSSQGVSEDDKLD